MSKRILIYITFLVLALSMPFELCGCSDWNPFDDNKTAPVESGDSGSSGEDDENSDSGNDGDSDDDSVSAEEDDEDSDSGNDGDSDDDSVSAEEDDEDSDSGHNGDSDDDSVSSGEDSEVSGSGNDGDSDDDSVSAEADNGDSGNETDGDVTGNLNSGGNSNESGSGSGNTSNLEATVANNAEICKLKYTGNPYIILNDNIPRFSRKAKRRTDAFENYKNLDSLGRCGRAYANVCEDLMPEEERGEIGFIRPSGWHTVKYNDLIDGNYLYNRCHLIGYQLTGENANELNLITGTRYFNVEGMLPFENEVADAVDEYGYHVLYRVTPVYDGNNLVANGVRMEAYSVEDKGEAVSFDVFVFNVQPGIIIDYATGDSKKDPAYKGRGTKVGSGSGSDTGNGSGSDTGSGSGGGSNSGSGSGSGTGSSTGSGSGSGNGARSNSGSESGSGSGSGSGSEKNEVRDYVVNKNTGKFHLPSCSSVKDIAEHNRWDFTGTKEELYNQGYEGCKICNP